MDTCPTSFTGRTEWSELVLVLRIPEQRNLLLGMKITALMDAYIILFVRLNPIWCISKSSCERLAMDEHVIK